MFFGKYYVSCINFMLSQFHIREYLDMFFFKKKVSEAFILLVFFLKKKERKINRVELSDYILNLTHIFQQPLYDLQLAIILL